MKQVFSVLAFCLFVSSLQAQIGKCFSSERKEIKEIKYPVTGARHVMRVNCNRYCLSIPARPLQDCAGQSFALYDFTLMG